MIEKHSENVTMLKVIGKYAAQHGYKEAELQTLSNNERNLREFAKEFFAMAVEGCKIPIGYASMFVRSHGAIADMISAYSLQDIVNIDRITKVE